MRQHGHVQSSAPGAAPHAHSCGTARVESLEKPPHGWRVSMQSRKRRTEVHAGWKRQGGQRSPRVRGAPGMPPSTRPDSSELCGTWKEEEARNAPRQRNCAQGHAQLRLREPCREPCRLPLRNQCARCLPMRCRQWHEAHGTCCFEDASRLRLVCWTPSAKKLTLLRLSVLARSGSSSCSSRSSRSRFSLQVTW